MKDGFYVLPADKAWAYNRISELEKQIDSLGPEFEEVFAQSSETYHDNAPFDALRDKQSLMAAQRHALKQVVNKAAISCPVPAKNTVGIGSRVVVEEGGKTHSFYISGHWSPHTGTVQNGAMVITCASPLGQALIDTKVASLAVMQNPGRQLLVKSCS